MDALSDVLRVFSLRGGVFLDAQFTAPWSVVAQVEPQDLQFPLPKSAHLMAYHYVVTGSPILEIEGQPAVTLSAGEVVLLPRNDVHTLGSASGVPSTSAGPLVFTPKDGGLAQIRHGGGGEVTQIICGFIGSESGRHALIDALPQALRLNVRDWEAGAWVEMLFRYAAQETAARRPGSASSLTKVSELLFVEAVRKHLQAVPAPRTGWIAGLVDPVVGRALASMHERPEFPWTVELLAEHVHLSRSAFADRFTSLIGKAPLGYLADWRMQVAKHLLCQGRTIAQIANQVGYDSEAAFSRAFKREVGCAPTVWRQSQ